MFELEEKDYYEAFGLEQPEEEAEGEEEQEIADPAEADADRGEEEQEAADPDSQEPSQEPEGEPEKKGQSADERRAQAAARRQREIDAAVEAAKQQQKAAFDDELKQFFAQAGLRNPMKDNSPITTMEEFREYQRAFSSQQIDQQIKTGKATRETYEQIIRDMPEMQDLQTLKAQQEAAAQHARQIEIDKAIDHDIAELAKLDPALNTRDAVAAYAQSDDGQTFARYVRENKLSLQEAYLLANKDQLEARKLDAERTRTANNLRGKEHLKGTKGQGKGLTSVPAEVREQFRLYNPTATDAEILAYYNKYIKKE